jgi:hypothetical protein
MIRIDSIWRDTEPMDMRSGAETALAKVIKVFGATKRTVLICSPTAVHSDESSGA